MTILPSLMRWLTIGLIFSVALATGCSKDKSKPAAPAAKPGVEGELARVTLTPVQQQALKLESAVITSKPVQERVQLTGWVMARPGNEVTITAEIAGYVREPALSRTFPLPGQPVEKGSELLFLEPVVAPLEQIQLAALKRGMENELAKAKESEKAAKLEVERVEGLVSQGLRSKQDLEQAQVRLRHAQEDIKAADDKLKSFADSSNGSRTVLRPVAVVAPRSGTVLAVHVSPGQYVPAAAPLVTIIHLDPIWLRVPIPEHDLPRLDRAQSVIVALDPDDAAYSDDEPDRRRDNWLDARPITFVPQVDPVRHTADALYELPPLPAGRNALVKDQMLTVFVPLTGRRKETVVPYTAVVFDAYAGAWIYLDKTTGDKPEEYVYQKRRVDLGPAIGDGVVIRSRCEPGERVVIRGAAKLFSSEFHKPPAKKN